MLEDDSEGKQAEKALKQSEESLAAELAAMSRLHELSTRLVPAGDSSSLLQEIADVAIAITTADMGKIQLIEPKSGTLRIVASRGFDQAFLRSYELDGPQPASVAAMMAGVRVVVDDVAKSPLFTRSSSLEMLLAANVRAVQ